MTTERTEGVIMRPGGGPPPAPPSHAAASDALLPRDAADVADIVAHAAASQRTLRIAAGESWLDAGRPVTAHSYLHLASLTGIVEYNPADLTLTARAGTTLREIAAITARHNQWLALDAPGGARGTVGATIATASAGPLAASIGLPRDLVLGMEFVSGDGDRIRGGGRVVKNVAGFDLVRLQTGAWGTLGVITEVTVRLRGRPEVDCTLALSAPPSINDAMRLVRRFPEAPLAAECLNGPLAAMLGLGDGPCFLVRLGGNADAIDAQTRYLSALGDCVTPLPKVWSALREIEPPGALVARVSAAQAMVADTWNRVSHVTQGTGALVHATLARGVVRVILPPVTGSSPLTQLLALRSLGRCVVERAPAEVWSGVPPQADDRLSRRLRCALDPAGVLNPGILAGCP